MSNNNLLCKELEAVLKYELNLGNELIEPPQKADWPSVGSIFARLKNDMQMDKYVLPQGVMHLICSDIHYGWNDECMCIIHKHLLVAGQTKLINK